MNEKLIKTYQEKIKLLDLSIEQARQRYDWNAYEIYFRERTTLAVELQQLRFN
tara:strand:+ start:53 stop:211 length:159 start_codon:yes stop_codon:yes gene_type:complete